MSDDDVELTQPKTSEDVGEHTSPDSKADTSPHRVHYKVEDKSSSTMPEMMSPYQQSGALWTAYRTWDSARWWLNAVLLFRPLSPLAACTSTEYAFYQQYIFDWNVADIIVGVLVFSTLLSGTVTFAKGNGFSGLGHQAEKWYAYVWILAQRNTIWNWFLGISPERIYIYHKLASLVPFTLGLYHGLLNNGDDRRRLSSDEGGGLWFGDRASSGWWCIGFHGAIFVFSFYYVRRFLFNKVFLPAHFISFFGIYLALVSHSVSGPISLALFFSVVDWGLRFLLAAGRPATIKRMEILGPNVIKIVFDMANFKYAAGQWVNIYIPAVSWFEVHPFSLSSCPDDDEICIHIRVMGSWTRRLRAFVAMQDKGRDWSNLHMFVEGAYGGSYSPFRKYKHVLLISGGIGITPMQSICNQMIHDIRHRRGGGADGSKPPIYENIQFVWTIREPTLVGEFAHRHWSSEVYRSDGTVAPMSAVSDGAQIVHDTDAIEMQDDTAPKLGRLPSYFAPDLLIVREGLQRERETNVRTEFYVTRATEEEQESLSAYPFIKHGRPDVEKLVSDFSKNAAGMCSNDVLVLSCGPPALVEEVRRVTAKYQVECHTEIFEF